MTDSSEARDRYFARRRLGRGAGGTVWAVRDREQGGAPRALKELSVDAAEEAAALRREFATLATLRHPNLVEVFDFDLAGTGGSPRFSMELIEGADLVQTVRREGPAALEHLAVEALRALAFLHDFGILHRDLKPANILVRGEAKRNARLVLLDFGLAARGDGSGDPAALGTLSYAPPELLDGKPATRRSDLYSLGAVLFEAVHGRPPFEPADGDLSGFVKEVRAGSDAVPVPDGYPDALSGFIAELMAVDPGDRPGRASEALARLDQVYGVTHELETRATRAARLGSGDPPGREDELRQLERLLTVEDPTTIVWLTGEAGSGKTRILGSLAARWIGAGGELRRTLLLDDSRDGAMQMQDAVDATLAQLRAAAADNPTLVLLDEFESATPSQVHALRQLAAEGNAPRLKIVAALREAEIDAGLRRLLDDRDLLDGTERLVLEPLGKTALDLILRRLDPDLQAPDERLDGLATATGGNALVVETVLIEGDDLQSRAAIAAGDRIAASIGRRVEALSSDARKCLEALAVLDAGASPGQVARLAGLEEVPAAAALTEAVSHGLVRRAGDAFTAGSPSLVESLIARMTSRQLADLAAVAARLIEDDAGTSSAEAGRLARLWQRAGDPERALACALRAAEFESERGAPGVAADWLRFGLLLLSRRDPRRRPLRRKHAEALRTTGRLVAAARAYATVTRLTENPADRIEMLSEWSSCLAIARRTELALSLAQRAVRAAADSHPDKLGRARVAEGLARKLAGDNAAAIEVLQRAVEDTDDTRTGASALAVLATAESHSGQFDTARRHFASALHLARRSGDVETEGRILVGLAQIEQRSWRPEAAARAFEKARAHTARHRLRDLHVAVLNCQALLFHDRGHYDRTLRLLAEAEPQALHLDARNSWLLIRLQRADSLIQIGRPAEAAGLMERLLAGSRHGFEGAALRFAEATLAEALLESPGPDVMRIGKLLKGPLEAPGSLKLTMGALVVELERRSRPDCGEPFDPVWDRYQTLLDDHRAAVEPYLEVRARMARARALLNIAENDAAIESAGAAASLAEDKGFMALAARALALVALAADRLGRTRDAQNAWDKGRRSLDQAAARIEDDSMRRDFLARPVFAPLREAAAHSGGESDRLAALYDMIHALNSETDPERMLESMLDMALRVVGAERGMILLRERVADDFVPRVARNLEQQTINDVTEFSKSVVRAAGAGEAVLSVDAGTDQRLDAYKSMSLYGIRSVICVPLKSRGKPLGVVYVDDRTAHGVFSENDLRFLEAFADHAGLALENAQIRGNLERENQRLQVAAEARVQFGNMVGRSAAMQEVFDLIERVAETKLPVLIHGESGTGKELVAQAIHYHGPLKQQAFLTENCAAIPETLLESELFGHTKGSFTGAERDRRGLFEQADGGTLFLDEVGDMSPGMQAGLLRVLQEGELRRVGGSQTIKVDVRVIAATHRDLREEVAAGRFREDLMYRLQVLEIDLPPLRERHGDIPLLVDHLLKRISEDRGRPVPRIRTAVMDLLERYAWPGNVRQLESTMQRLALLAGDGPVTVATVESDKTLRQTLIVDGGKAPPLSIQQSEKDRIVEALKTADGNRTRAARLLGISRATIFRRIKEYDL